MSRRRWLGAVTASGFAATLPASLLLGAEAGIIPKWREGVLNYLETLTRPDGGYAWADQPNGHLTPTFAAVGCYQALGQTTPRKKVLAEFVRTHHPSHLKKLEQERRIFEYQQVRSLAWLGEDVSALRERIGQWEKPLAYLKQYEKHGHPLFPSEMGVLLSRELLGMEFKLPEFVAYLNSRRRPNGSFNNTPAEEGGDGHIVNTWWGLQVLRLLGRAEERKSKTIEWIRACQLPNGGFTWQIRPEFGGVDDAAYTWAACRSLHALGAKPKDPAACIGYLRSLANSDGGFGDRPGWESNAVATYYAVDALAALSALDTSPSTPARRPANPKSLPSDLKVFTIQLEAHGKGSPAEAVDLARALKIHLWGAKGATPRWLARAQTLADAAKAPVQFFVSDEEYGTWVDVPGLGTYSHTSDIIAPSGAPFGSSMASQGVLSWADFRQRRLAPLEKAGGRLIWQFGENEELVRLYLDDSLERGGYATISTFHFGNPDFTNTEPFLNRYRGRIPFVGLHDSHGNEPWWFADITTGFRTLFLARSATWENWLEALRNNWVVAARHDAVSQGQTWMHAGSTAVERYVREREGDWRWWDNPEIRRPLVSLVAVQPGDEFEAGRPETGVLVRVRCAWTNTPQGVAKEPLAELSKLVIDRKEVSPTLMDKKQPRGPNRLDYYHGFHLEHPSPGSHTASVTIKELATGQVETRSLEFIVE